MLLQGLAAVGAAVVLGSTRGKHEDRLESAFRIAASAVKRARERAEAADCTEAWQWYSDAENESGRVAAEASAIGAGLPLLAPRIGHRAAALMRARTEDEVRALRKHLLRVCG